MKVDWYPIFNYYEAKTKKELKPFINQGYTILSCDASYKKRLGACSTLIINNQKKYVIQNKSFIAKGPVESELKSILFGLRRLEKLAISGKILVTNDNYYAINFAAGNFTPKIPYIAKVTKSITKVISQLNQDIKFCLVRSKVNKSVDKAAKQELKIKESNCERKINERIKRVNAAKDRAINLRYKVLKTHVEVQSDTSGETYVVTLDPISCSCNYWSRQWANKESKIIKARALPCKHICKAAEAMNRDIFQLFRRPIFRLD